MWKHLKTISLCLLGKYQYYSHCKGQFLGSLPYLLGPERSKGKWGPKYKIVPCCSYLIAQTHNATSWVWPAPRFSEHFHVALGYMNEGTGNPPEAVWCLLGVGGLTQMCFESPWFLEKLHSSLSPGLDAYQELQMGYLGHVWYSDMCYSKTSRSSCWICRKLLFLMGALRQDQEFSLLLWFIIGCWI